MKSLYFFLGTEAELIKIFPVILEAKKNGFCCRIIASGQNDITKSKIIKATECGTVDLELSKENEIKKTAVGLLIWWFKTYRSAVKKISAAFSKDDFTQGIMIVHGDTISTVMGAMIGKKLGMLVCHVEAGLRSFNLLSPFPEEIDRLLTSNIARLHFAPGDVPYNNLKNAKGSVINTKQNTLLDSLRFSQSIPVERKDIRDIIGSDYFVFVMHRQENLISKAFVSEVIQEIKKASSERKCVFLLHKITENTLIGFDLMDELKDDPNIILFHRVEYFDFMKLLQYALFVITDGGSNQEELYYMNKPCLILRRETERKEGLGANARLFNGKPEDIRTFIQSYNSTLHDNESELFQDNPSKIIIQTLISANEEK